MQIWEAPSLNMMVNAYTKPFEIVEFKTIGILKFCNFEVLKLWDFETHYKSQKSLQSIESMVLVELDGTTYQIIMNQLINRLLMVNGSWLMAQGTWLMTQGSLLMANEILPQGPRVHEPWALSHEPWTINHWQR